MITALLVSCGEESDSKENSNSSQETSTIDYASSVKLDLNSSETMKIKAEVKLFVDGDTTHFYVDKSIVESGVLKARYLSINTPESTGKIEEYGKAASNYTKETLSKATSIYLESDDNKLNADSTGDRYLVWVWYKTSDSEEYRNLNIEILQKGLAIASSSANNRYGTICVDAINQAKAQKLAVHSGIKDPDFYYGEAVELTLKELRCNIEQYNGIKVAFNGIITKNEGSSVYMEAFDAETEMYYGISVYYGYNLSGDGLDIMSVGNESRIVGTVTYYEA
ncbi:MAG: thermonuclease family protein, partial [Clostridia bacterium]|nr:thermonuclease family protein [Clostridia bacterium]